MHNVKRQTQSQDAILARKEKERSKIAEYLSLTSSLLQLKSTSTYTPEAFALTTRVLTLNPEFYTAWNYRRNILTNALFPDAPTPQDINTLLANDLDMTAKTLKAHPKVYWIWNHRRWCLEMIPEEGEYRKKVWLRELAVVERMLDADARNFMAWNYRRYILASMPPPRKSAASELLYTTQKIQSSFSNFSAWHQRSKVLGDGGAVKEREFDLVRNAMYTDPNDQSVWIYHRWLIGTHPTASLLTREISAIQELLDEQPDSKWCMDSLVHYKRLLIPLLEDKAGVEQARNECLRLLGALRELDPMRERRYEDMEIAITKSK